MPKALTAENGAKGLLSGEFVIMQDFPCPECGGEGETSTGTDCELCEGDGMVVQPVMIPWTKIKEIYAMAVEHLAEEEEEDGMCCKGPWEEPTGGFYDPEHYQKCSKCGNVVLK